MLRFAVSKGFGAGIDGGSANDSSGVGTGGAPVRRRGVGIGRPGGARWGPRSERRPATPHNALTPRRGPATARGISPCRVRRSNLSRGRRRAPISASRLRGSRQATRMTPVDAGTRDRASFERPGREARRRTVGPPVRPEPATPHSTQTPGGAGYGRENFTVSRAPPEKVARGPDRRSGSSGFEGPGGARWGLPSGQRRQPHISRSPPKGSATAGRVSPCRVRRAEP